MFGRRAPSFLLGVPLKKMRALVVGVALVLVSAACGSSGERAGDVGEETERNAVLGDGDRLSVAVFGGTGSDVGRSVAVDGSGNVYTTGSFQGTVDFDPGAGTTNLVSAGAADVFVSKLDASGNLVWAKRFGSTGYDEGWSVAVDGLGNVYTIGSFWGTVDFDPGVNTVNLVSAGAADVFVSKLNASGNLVWAKRFGSTLNDVGNSVAVDGSGNVYTTGYFQGTVDFDPGVNTVNLVVVGQRDVFVSKLDASGNLVWAKSFGGTGIDGGESVAVDGSGNVHTTGEFYGTVDFDPSSGTTKLTSAGYEDVFVSKLNACLLYTSPSPRD